MKSSYFKLLIVIGAFFLTRIFSAYEPFTFLNFDPGWMADATRSLAEDGDLDLRNQLQELPGEALDQTALGVRGEWYPLHEYLLAIVAVPFFWVFGFNGLLLLNLFLALGFVLLTFRLTLNLSYYRKDQSSTQLVGFLPVVLATLLTALSPILLSLTYSFSLDIFSAVLVLGAVNIIVSERWILGGMAFGAAVLGRTGNAALLPAVAVYLLTYPNSHKQLFAQVQRVALGFVMPISALLLSNYYMFGSPLSFSYNNWQTYHDGALIVATQSGAFNRNFFNGLFLYMFGEEGLINNAPFSLLALFLVPFLWRQLSAKERFPVYIVISQIVFFSLYSLDHPPGSSRYLLGSIGLLCPILSTGIRRVSRC